MVRVVLLGLLLVPALSFGQDVITTSQGYKITPQAKHVGSELSFQGRCEGGPVCRTLRLTGCMVNQDGREVCRPALVENAGTAGRLFASEPAKVDPLKKGWRVFSVQAVCIQP